MDRRRATQTRLAPQALNDQVLTPILLTNVTYLNGVIDPVVKFGCNTSRFKE